MKVTTITAGLLVAGSSTIAQLNVNNWCGYDVFIYQSTNGECNKGPNGVCQGDWGSAPWVVGASSIVSLDWIHGASGTSVKIGLNDAVDQILQLEYDFSDHLYFDLSNLDGDGASRTGTPFANENVGVTPTGNGANVDHCNQIKCWAGQICAPAFQVSDDPDVLACPLDTGTMWLDLCQPSSSFGKWAVNKTLTS